MQCGKRRQLIFLYFKYINTKLYNKASPTHTHICILPFHDSCNKTQETQVPALSDDLVLPVFFSQSSALCLGIFTFLLLFPAEGVSGLLFWTCHCSTEVWWPSKYSLCDNNTLQWQCKILHFSASLFPGSLLFSSLFCSLEAGEIWKRTDLMRKNILSIDIIIWNQYFFNNKIFFSFLYFKCYHPELHRKLHGKCHGWQSGIEH